MRMFSTFLLAVSIIGISTADRTIYGGVNGTLSHLLLQIDDFCARENGREWCKYLLDSNKDKETVLIFKALCDMKNNHPEFACEYYSSINCHNAPKLYPVCGEHIYNKDGMANACKRYIDDCSLNDANWENTVFITCSKPRMEVKCDKELKKICAVDKKLCSKVLSKLKNNRDLLSNLTTINENCMEKVQMDTYCAELHTQVATVENWFYTRCRDFIRVYELCNAERIPAGCSIHKSVCKLGFKKSCPFLKEEMKACEDGKVDLIQVYDKFCRRPPFDHRKCKVVEDSLLNGNDFVFRECERACEMDHPMCKDCREKLSSWMKRKCVDRHSVTEICFSKKLSELCQFAREACLQGKIEKCDGLDKELAVCEQLKTPDGAISVYDQFCVKDVQSKRDKGRCDALEDKIKRDQAFTKRMCKIACHRKHPFCKKCPQSPQPAPVPVPLPVPVPPFDFGTRCLAKTSTAEFCTGKKMSSDCDKYRTECITGRRKNCKELDEEMSICELLKNPNGVISGYDKYCTKKGVGRNDIRCTAITNTMFKGNNGYCKVACEVQHPLCDYCPKIVIPLSFENHCFPKYTTIQLCSGVKLDNDCENLRSKCKSGKDQRDCTELNEELNVCGLLKTSDGLRSAYDKYCANKDSGYNGRKCDAVVETISKDFNQHIPLCLSACENNHPLCKHCSKKIDSKWFEKECFPQFSTYQMCAEKKWPATCQFYKTLCTKGIKKDCSLLNEELAVCQLLNTKDGLITAYDKYCIDQQSGHNDRRCQAVHDHLQKIDIKRLQPICEPICEIEHALCTDCAQSILAKCGRNTKDGVCRAFQLYKDILSDKKRFLNDKSLAAQLIKKYCKDGDNAKMCAMIKSIITEDMDSFKKYLPQICAVDKRICIEMLENVLAKDINLLPKLYNHFCSESIHRELCEVIKKHCAKHPGRCQENSCRRVETMDQCIEALKTNCGPLSQNNYEKSKQLECFGLLKQAADKKEKIARLTEICEGKADACDGFILASLQRSIGFSIYEIWCPRRDFMLRQCSRYREICATIPSLSDCKKIALLAQFDSTACAHENGPVEVCLDAITANCEAAVMTHQLEDNCEQLFEQMHLEMAIGARSKCANPDTQHTCDRIIRKLDSEVAMEKAFQRWCPDSSDLSKTECMAFSTNCRRFGGIGCKAVFSAYNRNVRILSIVGMIIGALIIVTGLVFWYYLSLGRVPLRLRRLRQRRGAQAPMVDSQININSTTVSQVSMDVSSLSPSVSPQDKSLSGARKNGAKSSKSTGKRKTLEKKKKKSTLKKLRSLDSNFESCNY